MSGLRRTAWITAVVLIGAPAPAAARPGATYERCTAMAGLELVAAARTSCATAARVATAVLGAPADRSAAVLRASGWTPVRAREVPRRGPAGHDLVAIRGNEAVRLRRPGNAPDLDGWAAGRELIFATGRIVGGTPIPPGTATCTSAFLVRLRGGRSAGLSAAHCAGLRRDGRVRRPNAALRRPPAPGIVLGRVAGVAWRGAPLDALALPVSRGATAAPVVDRGVSRPPWVVAGAAIPVTGLRICFSGVTSGIDRCGLIRGAPARPVERALARRAGVVVRCTTIRARPGDSGAAVHTQPRADGTVRAVGITSLIVGARGRMCFTPIAPVLERLRATLRTSD